MLRDVFSIKRRERFLDDFKAIIRSPGIVGPHELSIKSKKKRPWLWKNF